MNFPSKLKFLDLSFNYLTTIDSEILNFMELKTLYLHGNYIYQLEEVKKLSEFPNILTLTLHGNPLEQITGYRNYVLGIMFSKNQSLKKMDSVVVTRKEKEGCFVWNQILNQQKKSFPKLDTNKIKKTSNERGRYKEQWEKVVYKHGKSTDFLELCNKMICFNLKLPPRLILLLNHNT